jgi:acyl-CoA reductase-like NAD-dependent aldehyde dehydrogenase
MPICFIENVTSNQSAIEQINSSIFGISATLYSNDKNKIYEIGKDLEVGVVGGNRWGFAPGVPYSPRKRSGKGNSFSVDSFSNVTRSQSLKGYFL